MLRPYTHSCSATYATFTGRPGSRSFLIRAASTEDMAGAIAIARKRLEGLSKLDYRIVPLATGKEPT
jgi:hypothetical protein